MDQVASTRFSTGCALLMFPEMFTTWSGTFVVCGQKILRQIAKAMTATMAGITAQSHR